MPNKPVPRTNSPKPKYSVMTDEQRKALCQKVKDEPRTTQKELVTWLELTHGVKTSQATVSNTLKHCQKLLVAQDVNLRVKRHRVQKWPKVDVALYEWFLQHQELVNISGELIKEKAVVFMKLLYPGGDASRFESKNWSNGWLEAFKQRYGIKSFRRFGESGAVDMTVVERELPKLREVLDQYSWGDIYNMDETGLFFRMQADHSLANKLLEGRKQEKERLTVVVCANGDGSHKLPLYVIGKHWDPRCFKGINRSTLGVEYRANGKAWMTAIIFVEWIQWFDHQMRGRRALLLIDNCPVHKVNVGELKNTVICFLPPNTTSKLQPCDAGIIRTLKAHYRRHFNRHLLYELMNPAAKKLNVLQAIKFLVQAWSDDVTPGTIGRCFLHCKIRSEVDAGGKGEAETGPEQWDSEIKEQIRALSYSEPMALDFFLDHPQERKAMAMPTEEEIATEVLEEEEERDPSEATASATVPAKAAVEAAKLLEDWCLQQDLEQNGAGELMKALRTIKTKASAKLASSLKQKSLLDYFGHNGK
jgi:hypothetical protein